MSSHHFIGNGLVSRALTDASAEPDLLALTIANQVQTAGLAVVDHRAVRFDNGGLTLAWILAESHLVLHHWAEEGYATIDLHVCDYGESNAVKAAALVETLTAFCFTPGTARWHEIHLEEPAAARSA
ncbi:MAG: S-adenosylmethionine decarboxylase [Thermoanaerobaculia bacterium]